MSLNLGYHTDIEQFIICIIVLLNTHLREEIIIRGGAFFTSCMVIETDTVSDTPAIFIGFAHAHKVKSRPDQKKAQKKAQKRLIELERARARFYSAP